jgi:hypothetical protein
MPRPLRCCKSVIGADLIRLHGSGCRVTLAHRSTTLAKALKGYFKLHGTRRHVLLGIHQRPSLRDECIEKTLSVPKLALEIFKIPD